MIKRRTQSNARIHHGAASGFYFALDKHERLQADISAIFFAYKAMTPATTQHWPRLSFLNCVSGHFLFQ
jgi:hypothetical protein